MNVTLNNIELFILVIHFDHFLKGSNNLNSCLNLKHDLSCLRYNSCQVNELFETLSTSNVTIENLNIQSKGLVMTNTPKNLEMSLKAGGVFESF